MDKSKKAAEKNQKEKKEIAVIKVMAIEIVAEDKILQEDVDNEKGAIKRPFRYQYRIIYEKCTCKSKYY